MPSIKPDHATWNVTWTVLIQIQSFSRRFIFLHLSTLPRSDFPGSHGVKKHYRLVLFQLNAHTTKFLYFLCFLSWRMETLQWARNVWRVSSQISQDDTFVHYPFFKLNIPLFTFSYPNFFRYLFVLTYLDSSWRYTHTTTTHTTGTQILRTKMTSLDDIFCRGNKSSFCSLRCRKHKEIYHSCLALVKKFELDL